MNIVYKGRFLGDGFRKLGHTIIDLPEGESLPQSLGKLSQAIDLVVVELYGSYYFPHNLSEVLHETAAYCIDSPLNEFWMRQISCQFDHVFVDQKNIVDNFANYGIKSEWLPLCAQESYLMPKLKKELDITFVGTVNNERLKRFNWLSHIKKYFSITVAQNLNYNETQKLFGKSRIVLNENFFSGVTLRLFQGIAANSLVFTETGAPGLSDIFPPDKALIDYNHNNIIDKLNLFLSKPDLCDGIAQFAYEKCKKHDMPVNRARQIIESVKARKKLNVHKSAEENLFNEISSFAKFTMRFGGELLGIIPKAKSIGESDSIYAADANLLLGDIFAIGGNLSFANKYYEKSLIHSDKYHGLLKMAQASLVENDTARAKVYLDKSLSLLPDNMAAAIPNDAQIANAQASILYKIAQIYFQMGKNFDFGFSKNYKNIIPDTAFEIAMQSWNLAPSPWAMDMMLACLEPYGIGGELLPMLVEGIKSGCLSDRQILHTADVAASYYDFDLADTIVKAFKTP